MLPGWTVSAITDCPSTQTSSQVRSGDARRAWFRRRARRGDRSHGLRLLALTETLDERIILGPEIGEQQAGHDQDAQKDDGSQGDRAGGAELSRDRAQLRALVHCPARTEQVDHRLWVQPQVLRVGADEAARVDGGWEGDLVLVLERFQVAAMDASLALGVGKGGAQVLPRLAEGLAEGAHRAPNRSAPAGWSHRPAWGRLERADRPVLIGRTLQTCQASAQPRREQATRYSLLATRYSLKFDMRA